MMHGVVARISVQIREIKETGDKGSALKQLNLHGVIEACTCHRVPPFTQHVLSQLEDKKPVSQGYTHFFVTLSRLVCVYMCVWGGRRPIPVSQARSLSSHGAIDIQSPLFTHYQISMEQSEAF